jgi:hypothetical protein
VHAFLENTIRTIVLAFAIENFNLHVNISKYWPINAEEQEHE